MKKIKAVTWVSIAITFLISFIEIIFLPDKIAIQWNEQGISNEGSKYVVLYLPFISLVICAVYMSIAKTLRYIVPLVTSILILICEAVILVNAFGFINITHIGTPTSNLWIGRILSIIVGVVIIIIGNRLPKIIMNYYIGVKTPWAMNNNDIWIKTQRFAGKLWFAVGLILIGLAFSPAEIEHAGRVLCFIAIAILPRIYSYKLFDKQNK